MRYEDIKKDLVDKPKCWLVTGVAGFIGSNLLETLLGLNQKVVGLDNFSTGLRQNLSDVKICISAKQWDNFRLIEGDIKNLSDCMSAVQGIDIILHQAALGSVPRSIKDPIASNDANVVGFLNMLWAAKSAGVKRFVYASSSSVYGDSPGLPKVEDCTGNLLSPYAVTKFVNELYAKVFSRSYGLETIGLRYFNVFGKRQDPESTYAAVIPIWFRNFVRKQPIIINGDGETSRDFCFVENAVQANILAGMATEPKAFNRVYNVSFGQQTTLNILFQLIRERVSEKYPEVLETQPTYHDFRAGDIRHSLAKISDAQEFLGYNPLYSLKDGLLKTSD